MVSEQGCSSLRPILTPLDLHFAPNCWEGGRGGGGGGGERVPNERGVDACNLA